MKFGTEQIGKHKIEVEVDRKGQFSAEFDEVTYSASTVNELTDVLKKAVKRLEKVKPIAVTVLGMIKKAPTSKWDTEKFSEGDGAIDALLRGYHERNRVWLLTTVEGQHKFQVGGYGNRAVIARRLTLQETIDYQARLEARRVAVTAVEDFIGAAKVDPAALLEAARKAADK